VGVGVEGFDGGEGANGVRGGRRGFDKIGRLNACVGVKDVRMRLYTEIGCNFM
jgi:hypothetical protein